MLSLFCLSQTEDDEPPPEDAYSPRVRVRPGASGALQALQAMHIGQDLSSRVAVGLRPMLERATGAGENSMAGVMRATAAGISGAGRPAAPGGLFGAAAGRPAAPGGKGIAEPGWPYNIKAFENGAGNAAKAMAYGSGIGFAKNMMTKAVGLQTGAYGYDASGAGISTTPNNGLPETNLCYGLLETWLRSCSRPSMMLQTHAGARRRGGATVAVAAAAAPEPPALDVPALERLLVALSNATSAAAAAGGPARDDLGSLLSAVQRATARPPHDGAAAARRLAPSELHGLLTTLHAVSALAQHAAALDSAPALAAAASATASAFAHNHSNASAAAFDESPPAGATSLLQLQLGTELQWQSASARETDRRAAMSQFEARESGSLDATLERTFRQLQGGGSTQQQQQQQQPMPLQRAPGWSGSSSSTAAAPAALPTLARRVARTGMRPAAPSDNGVTNNSPVNGMSFGACMKYYWKEAGFPFGWISFIVYMTGCFDRLIFKPFGSAASSAPSASTYVKTFISFLSRAFQVGGARGGRVTFAAPEEYDPSGLYGPEPFPFQTPGAEKCHRMLNTWLFKCESTQG